LGELPHRAEVLVGGMLSALKYSNTRNPRPGSNHTRYVMFDLEDLAGNIRCIVWPEQFAEFGELVAADAILAVRAVVDRRPGSEEVNLIVDELIPLDQLAKRMTRGVIIRVNEQDHSEQSLDRLYEILRGYPGDCELQLVVCLADGSRVYMKSEGVRIALNSEMRDRVDDLLGAGNLRPLVAPLRATQSARRGNGRQMARR
jgi:DNA polymerase-3 subunit alpha